MTDERSAMPDLYDRLLGQLDGLPDTVKTKAVIVRVIPPLGVGGTQTFVIQTVRQYDRKTRKDTETGEEKETAKARDTIFLETVNAAGLVRLVIPAEAADVIARQRDQLTAKARSKASTATARARTQAGIAPAFLKGKAS